MPDNETKYRHYPLKSVYITKKVDENVERTKESLL